jgi:tRNA 2-thiouridine synthesizing protein A
MLSPCSELPATATTYDARGLPCPLPLLRLARELRGLRPGEVIALLADDPAARDDVATWTRRSGHALLCWEPGPPHDVYYVRKRRGESP